MAKRVLLISVRFMSLYKDIVNELENQGYIVDYLEDKELKFDFYYIQRRGQNKLLQFIQGVRNRYHWKCIIKKNHLNYFFDFLIVIDGFSLINSGFIDYLERINPSIKKVLYLFDRTYKNYRFDLMFNRFDKIFTFDYHDSQIYGINLLPIYWAPVNEDMKSIDVFGFGTYLYNRWVLFSYVKEKAKKLHLKEYIKLYCDEESNTPLSKLIRCLRGPVVPASVYFSSITTHKKISPKEFRNMIATSKIVLDTHDIVQDGLTARFMWALGAGAKIITTNEAIKYYDFYNPDQVMIVDIDNINIDDAFWEEDFHQEEKYKKLIEKYRIDNWVKTLLS